MDISPTPIASTASKRFTCSKCGTGFGHKTHINNHFKRKTSCVTDDNSMPTCITILHTNCLYCGDQVKTETEVNFMKKHLENCICKPLVPTVTNNIGNITNITNYNYLQVNSYGDPSLGHLVYDERLVMNRVLLLKQVNFNPDIPENHNIFYVKETGMYRLYNSSNYAGYTDVPYDKLLVKLSTPLDKAQDYLINTGLMTIEEKKELIKKVDIEYKKDSLNMDYYTRVIKDCSKIPENTRQKYFDKQA